MNPETPPADPVRDTYGNHWRLHTPGLQVRVAGTHDWRPAPGPALPGVRFVAADHAAFVWRASEQVLERLDPRRPDGGWIACAIDGDVLTALATSPDDMLLAGFASGRIAEIDMDAGGTPHIVDKGRADGPVRELRSTDDGVMHADTDAGPLHLDPPAGSWHRHWRPRARLPAGNHDLFAVEHDGRLWMAGGLAHGYGLPALMHVFDELLAYDVHADRWEIVDRMPFPRCYSGIAEMDDHLWIVGGAANLSAPGDPDGPREPLADVRLYDPRSGTWTEGPPLTHPRLEPVVHVVGGRLWAVGGSDGEPLDAVESIGPGESTWRAEAPLPHPVSQAAGCVLDGVLYVVSRAGFLAFDPHAGGWDVSLPQPADPPQAAQVAAHEGRVWVMGGSRRRDTTIYDPAARTWTAGPGLPCDNSWGAALSLGGELIVAGGAHRSERHETYFFDDRVWSLR